MDVLLTGGAGRMMDAFIDRLNKDGHRVFLFTGSRKKNGKAYHKVFQRYDYGYTDDVTKDLIENIRPDMVVFLGAYDTNFEWDDEKKDSADYAAALTAILSAYSVVSGGRFVYLSSHEVFGGSYPNDIFEDEPCEPRGFKAMAITRGEEICKSFSGGQGIDVRILRFDHLYGQPVRGVSESNICFQMCLEALKTGKVSANDRHSFSLIYLKDAVELAYKVMMADTVKQQAYHISSGEEINSAQLAGFVQKAMGGGIRVINTAVGDKQRLVLDGTAFAEEFGCDIFVNYKEGVETVGRYMKRHAESFLAEEDKGLGPFERFKRAAKRAFKLVLPFVENIVLFIPFFILNLRAADSRFFSRLDFLLLYVLLLAVVHGQRQAIFSSLLAVVGYIYIQMQDATGFSVMLDYNVYVWMAQLFIIGMVVGYMRDQLLNIRIESKEEVDYLTQKVDDIADINDSNVRMKQGFEAQLVNQRDSMGKIYGVVSRLDSYKPEEVLFYAAKVLGELMDTGSAAIYQVANADYARLFSYTSPEAKKLGNSIKYSGLTEMAKALSNGEVFVNKKLDPAMPLMASGIYDGEKLSLILMVWDIPWQRMTISEASRLIIIGRLIQNSTGHANRYLNALEHMRYLAGTHVMEEKAFRELVDAFLKAKKDGLTECVVLSTGLVDYMLGEARVGRLMRQTDYMGVMNGRFCVLLSNTGMDGAAGVMMRFKDAGVDAVIREEALSNEQMDS